MQKSTKLTRQEGNYLPSALNMLWAHCKDNQKVTLIVSIPPELIRKTIKQTTHVDLTLYFSTFTFHAFHQIATASGLLVTPALILQSRHLDGFCLPSDAQRKEVTTRIRRARCLIWSLISKGAGVWSWPWRLGDARWEGDRHWPVLTHAPREPWQLTCVEALDRYTHR